MLKIKLCEIVNYDLIAFQGGDRLYTFIAVCVRNEDNAQHWLGLIIITRITRRLT